MMCGMTQVFITQLEYALATIFFLILFQQCNIRFVVESYNLASDQWATRPSLNKKKGSLAGTVLHEKIFAIGGGNGIDCFSEVEIFDPNVGRWIFTKSMLFKVSFCCL